MNWGVKSKSLPNDGLNLVARVHSYSFSFSTMNKTSSCNKNKDESGVITIKALITSSTRLQHTTIEY